jgi:hypothetical protein
MMHSGPFVDATSRAASRLLAPRIETRPCHSVGMRLCRIRAWSGESSTMSTDAGGVTLSDAVMVGPFPEEIIVLGLSAGATLR